MARFILTLNRQVSSRSLYEGTMYGFLTFGWGSCSGCDALLACGSFDRVMSLLHTLKESIIWKTKEDMLEYFSAFSFSDETGVAKPHAFAFRKVLEELNCSPDEALHIGDIERTDIKGAVNVGMRAIKYCGDNSVFLDKYRDDSTQAEFVTDSWLEIENYIEKKNINFL